LRETTSSILWLNIIIPIGTMPPCLSDGRDAVRHVGELDALPTSLSLYGIAISMVYGEM
jgi:hypothetical protein